MLPFRSPVKANVGCTVALALRSRRDERIIASELSAAVKKEHSRCRENDYRCPRRHNERYAERYAASITIAMVSA